MLEIRDNNPQLLPGRSLEHAKARYVVQPGQTVDLSQWPTREKPIYPISKDASHDILHNLRTDLHDLQKVLYAQDQEKVLIVVQAMDTGGKDGCIRHVFSGMDPQGVNVIPFKAPSREELAHDYLWRIHQEVPKNGHLTIFNRSHYEDIIAVRVKNLAPQEVWERRYQHIINFEQMLADEGVTIVKIFLHLSKNEQQERLQARLDNPDKHWKFNPDDLKDRARWDEFQEAYSSVLSATSTEAAPWFVIPADRKWYRNLVVAEIVRDRLTELGMTFPTITWDPSEVEIR